MSTNPNPFGGGGGQQPYQFLPESYGARGNGKVISDGVINSTTTFTSASANFTSADTGKTIMINGGQGTTSAPLITTITFVNATTVTLAAAATATASGCAAIYGTDDTAAINSAVTAASTYAQANQFKAQVVFGAKFYCLASGPTQTGNGSSTPTFNSQIPLPFPAAAGTTQKLILEFVGTGNGSHPQYFQGTIPSVTGTCLVSMVLAPASGGVAPFGAQSVLGGPTGSFGFTGGFANVKPVVTGIVFVCGALSQQIAMDFRFCSAADVDRTSCQAFSSVLGNAPALGSLPALMTTSNSIGLYMPTTGNNADSNVGWYACEGFGFGVAFAEHFNAQWLILVYTNIGMFVNQANTPVQHGASILIASVEASNIAIQANNTGGSNQFVVNIGLLDCEVINTWHVDDVNGAFNGGMYLGTEANAPLIHGAANVRIVYSNQARGHMASPPAVPASGSSATLVYRDASVVVHTGAGVTVSAVTIDGTATGLTMAASSSLAVQVPSGKTIALTYAGGTPTWDWWLT